MPEENADEVKGMQSMTETRLVEFFTEARDSGQLDRGIDPENSAMLISLLINGSAVLARSGKPIEEVRKAMDSSLAALNL